MIATLFDIEAKHRNSPIATVFISDFVLRESGQIAAETILQNPHITLYSLDFDNKRAVFVETPPDVDLSQAPFYYLAQYENAIRVLTISFETMIQLAESITIDDSRLVIVHSVGRSGSTLASQIFAQVEGVINISEPDALSLLAIMRFTRPEKVDELKTLLLASIHLLCKTPTETAWVIKGRGQIIELADWLKHYFPHTKNIFLYRNAETWLNSSIRAFGTFVNQPSIEDADADTSFRKFIKVRLSKMAQYNAAHLPSFPETLALMWLSTMERYLTWHDMGIEMLAIRYANWRSDPQKTAIAMLDYCNCLPADMTAVYKALNRDSQKGTYLSQQAVKHHKTAIKASDLEILTHQLQKHPIIKTADFEVPNTFTVKA